VPRIADGRVTDIDLPDPILDALSQLYWGERYPETIEETPHSRSQMKIGTI
jgi:hypothetical protein